MNKGFQLKTGYPELLLPDLNVLVSVARTSTGLLSLYIDHLRGYHYITLTALPRSSTEHVKTYELVELRVRTGASSAETDHRDCMKLAVVSGFRSSQSSPTRRNHPQSSRSHVPYLP